MRKHLTLFLLACMVAVTAWAQAPRIMPQGVLMPFPHGVASGDPLTDRVILWTRLSTTDANAQNITWRIATDTALTNVINQGTAIADPANDWCVKVDATGLSSNTWYYYQFEFNGRKSLVGRTRTLPSNSDNVNQLRFGVVSCSNLPEGFFNAYDHLAQRNDVDVVLHLGDYIYEGGGGTNALDGRNPIPGKEIITLSEYRLRYSQYHLDGDLMRLHQYYPWIAVWDDHETANNSWRNGAQNHTEGVEGTWVDRLETGRRVYSEWMPIRDPDANDPLRIWRSFNWGGLVNLIMLDTRIYGRDEQLQGTSNPLIPVPVLNTNDPALNSPTRSLLGDSQRNWLFDQLKNVSATWRALGQQVMMARLGGNLPLVGDFIVNPDQWDGYPVERKRILDTILTNNIPNNVVLSGDIHTAWANDIPTPGQTYAGSANSAAVEFVGMSVTSGNGIAGLPASQIQSFNPHIKFVDLDRHGYFITDFTPQRVQTDYVFVSTIDDRNYTVTESPSYRSDSGTRFLVTASAPSARQAPQVTLPPAQPNQPPVFTATSPEEVVLLSHWPNPFNEGFYLQYQPQQAGNIRLQLMDAAGRVAYTEQWTDTPGLHTRTVRPTGLVPGAYMLQLTMGKTSFTRHVVFTR